MLNKISESESETISNDVVPTNNVFITPAIIKECLKKLKPGKGDGD